MSNKPSDTESNTSEASDKKKVEFWTTLPGILTGFAGVITSMGALILALKQADLLPQRSTPPPDTSTQSQPIPANQTSDSFSAD